MTSASTTSSRVARSRCRRRTGSVGRAVPVARERGVEVDRVRHHGRAEHARGEQHGPGVLEPRHEPLRRAAPQSTGLTTTPGDEPDGDDREQRHHDRLERPLPPGRLQREDRDRDHADQHAAGEQRDAEQDLQRDRRRRSPPRGRSPRRRAPPAPRTRAGRRAGSRSPSSSGSVRPVTTPSFAERYCTIDRGRVRGDEHPDEQVPVLRARGEVRGDVAGVDVGDRGDERGPEQPEQPPLGRPRRRGRGHLGSRHATPSASGAGDSNRRLFPRRVRSPGCGSTSAGRAHQQERIRDPVLLMVLQSCCRAQAGPGARRRGRAAGPRLARDCSFASIAL